MARQDRLAALLSGGIEGFQRGFAASAAARQGRERRALIAEQAKTEQTRQKILNKNLEKLTKDMERQQKAEIDQCITQSINFLQTPGLSVDFKAGIFKDKDCGLSSKQRKLFETEFSRTPDDLKPEFMSNLSAMSKMKSLRINNDPNRDIDINKFVPVFEKFILGWSKMGLPQSVSRQISSEFMKEQRQQETKEQKRGDIFQVVDRVAGKSPGTFGLTRGGNVKEFTVNGQSLTQAERQISGSPELGDEIPDEILKQMGKRLGVVFASGLTYRQFGEIADALIPLKKVSGREKIADITASGKKDVAKITAGSRVNVAKIAAESRKDAQEAAIKGKLLVQKQNNAWKEQQAELDRALSREGIASKEKMEQAKIEAQMKHWEDVAAEKKQAAVEKRSRKRIPPATVLEELNQGKGLRVLLKKASDLYDPSFVGFVQGRIGAVRNLTGVGLTADEAQFRAHVKDISSIITYLRTGKALNQQEMKNIELVTAGVNNPDVRFLANMKRLSTFLDGWEKRKIDLLRDFGYATPEQAEEALNQADEDGYNPLVAEVIDAELLKGQSVAEIRQDLLDMNIDPVIYGF